MGFNFTETGVRGDQSGPPPRTGLVDTNPPENWLRLLPDHPQPSGKGWRVSNLQADSDEHLVANSEESHHKCSIRRRLGTAKPSFFSSFARRHSGLFCF